MLQRWHKIMIWNYLWYFLRDIIGEPYSALKSVRTAHVQIITCSILSSSYSLVWVIVGNDIGWDLRFSWWRVWWLIVLMMEVVSSSETLVNIYQTTRCNIPVDSHISKWDWLLTEDWLLRMLYLCLMFIVISYTRKVSGSTRDELNEDW
jgi:hypothetical protein